MKSLIEYIESLYLSTQTLAVQRMWLKSFINLLTEKQAEVEAKYRQEEILNKICDSQIDNADEFTPEEIRLAIETMRADKQMYGHRKIWAGSWPNTY